MKDTRIGTETLDNRAIYKKKIQKVDFQDKKRLIDGRKWSQYEKEQHSHGNSNNNNDDGVIRIIIMIKLVKKHIKSECI